MHQYWGRLDLMRQEWLTVLYIDYIYLLMPHTLKKTPEECFKIFQHNVNVLTSEYVLLKMVVLRNDILVFFQMHDCVYV